MTDATYKKALREAEKQLVITKEEHLRAQSVLDTYSARKCGVRGWMANWLQLRKSARQLRKKQADLDFLLEFEREQNKG